MFAQKQVANAAGVVSDNTWVRATEMLQDLVAGSTAPELLSDLAGEAFAQEGGHICRALSSRTADHHRLILRPQVAEMLK